jgi:hypothetical protein
VLRKDHKKYDFLFKNPAKLNLLKNPLNYKAKSQKAGLPNVLFWLFRVRLD